MSLSIPDETFMDLAVSGKILEDDLECLLEDAISYWHTIPDDDEDEVGVTLHLWLGMTWQEYAAWVEQSKTINEIVQERLNEIIK